MTNGSKFKTAQERAEAFNRFCTNTTMSCNGCVFSDMHGENYNQCRFAWLDLEAEDEKPLPCPFCGGECIKETKCMKGYRVFCEHESCSYVSSWKKTIGEAIAAHNRVAKAARGREVN